MGEKMIKTKHVAHCLVLAYPGQGHINPMIQFSKRLSHKGIKITLVTTLSFWNQTNNNDNNFSPAIELESISDGYDDGGHLAAATLEIYKDTFWKVGRQTLSNLIRKLGSSSCNYNNVPVDCVVYDAFMPWALDVAKEFGILGAAFFTQPCAVNNVYFHVHKKLIELPLSESEYSLPGLVKLLPQELPSFLYEYGSYPGYFDIVTDQFSNIHKADWVLANTFDELEQEVIEWLSKIWPLKTIGPCVPSMYLDKRLQHDKDYGISIHNQNIDACIEWLNDKPKGSVVYVSFGSMAGLSEKQTEELAYGLKNSNYYFMWVVRASEQNKLPKGTFLDTLEKGLIVTWCPQLQVLTHDAVGCFISHCGWNSTLEALSLGVPMIAMPLWTDQTINAKYIKDVWNMGLKVVVDEVEGVVKRETIGNCIKEIMESEKGNGIKENAIKWKNLAKDSVDEGGSSDKNIEEFVAKLAHYAAAK
ncbi:hypothetical protein HN51_060160 [Arachis hypogaea]|uniref:Glycosyltransferase n=1 Tax=Arachis hypogaea TaxID=3818 RepID=A0A444X8N1_ARAHY|nr:UDP-glycosyltransferase 74G1 [Arachis ipaensis]XP_025684051.1 UDP-glycosyltransferase 74G1 [Arachis hypogaea]QHN83740.1 UDP-glycosyltransferase [Arachis hypogaea]RYQ86055.1 hypothetical protein Ahy_B10g105720 [Arachis hypogaea]